LLGPSISYIWPREGGYRDAWCFVFGSRLNANCKVLFDGAELATTFIGTWDEFFPNTLSFKVPVSAAVGADHEVKVHNSSSGATSAAFAYRVVAPRGYRGYHGWRFANFSRPTIEWKLFRDFFGAATVEYADGTHRPAAQAWYDANYKGVGNGGNCYGMCVSSLKHYMGTLNTFHKTWFADPANHHTYVWWYPWCDQTRESVQEDQGGQLSLELATYINTYYNTQTHRDMWNRIQGNLLPARPVLGMWGGGGHAIVPYSVETAGDDHKIKTWDNNVPYGETETGGPDKSIAHVYWGANSFSYGGYNKAICLTYNECVVPPHLPAAAVGSMGALAGTQSNPNHTAICVLGGGTRVSQITNDQGRRFYDPNGTENTNAATRIPLSMRFLPLTGAPPQPDDPLTFIFSQAQGRSLTFELAGAGAKRFSCFMPGSVMTVVGEGTGQLQVNNIAQDARALRVPNPSQLRPTQVDIIRTLAQGERHFRLTQLQNLPTQAVSLVPAPDGLSLQVMAAQPLQFSLEISAPVGRGVQQAAFSGIAVAAGQRAVLQPTNWGNLAAGLNLQLRNLQSNQLQDQRIVRPR
jgi:hypothetical protein